MSIAKPLFKVGVLLPHPSSSKQPPHLHLADAPPCYPLKIPSLQLLTSVLVLRTSACRSLSKLPMSCAGRGRAQRAVSVQFLVHTYALI